MNLKDIRGDYLLSAGNEDYKLSITGDAGKPKAEIKQDTVKLKTKIDYSDNWLNLSFAGKEGTQNFRMTALVLADTETITGKIILPDGTESRFKAVRTAPFAPKDDKKKKEDTVPQLVALTYPNIGYGNTEKPKPENLLFKNATVWTSEEAGILENTDVLVKDGKISKIGKNLGAGGCQDN